MTHRNSYLSLFLAGRDPHLGRLVLVRKVEPSRPARHQLPPEHRDLHAPLWPTRRHHRAAERPPDRLDPLHGRDHPVRPRAVDGFAPRRSIGGGHGRRRPHGRFVDRRFRSGPAQAASAVPRARCAPFSDPALFEKNTGTLTPPRDAANLFFGAGSGLGGPLGGFISGERGHGPGKCSSRLLLTVPTTTHRSFRLANCLPL